MGQYEFLLIGEINELREPVIKVNALVKLDKFSDELRTRFKKDRLCFTRQLLKRIYNASLVFSC